jgi:hypothetical protein
MVVKIQGDVDKKAVRGQVEDERRIGRLLSKPGCANILKTYSASYRKRNHPPTLEYLYLEYVSFFQHTCIQLTE